jgi:hypothetical protein
MAKRKRVKVTRYVRDDCSTKDGGERTSGVATSIADLLEGAAAMVKQNPYKRCCVRREDWPVGRSGSRCVTGRKYGQAR